MKSIENIQSSKKMKSCQKIKTTQYEILLKLISTQNYTMIMILKPLRHKITLCVLTCHKNQSFSQSNNIFHGVMLWYISKFYLKFLKTKEEE